MERGRGRGTLTKGENVDPPHQCLEVPEDLQERLEALPLPVLGQQPQAAMGHTLFGMMEVPGDGR